MIVLPLFSMYKLQDPMKNATKNNDHSGLKGDRSGNYPHTLTGEVGPRKALHAVARERSREGEAADETRDTAVPKRTEAVSVEAAALREAAAALQMEAAAPGPPAAAEEAEPAPDAGPTATPGGAAEEGVPALWVRSRAADADTRTWCPTTVVSPPQQPSLGQEAEQPRIWPRSGESVASAGTRD
ncbi:hypothetical protein NDU88_012133 [Pleurodeles waltl]|uniref:Uncharacterized protein n=1 Tax=Pleurodeles waltl TaxID=8319 RepID=A0AAV7R5C0_PLEWA|nr:hypothetical protein NDU88_012133 [Pleurodeles waltl]